MAASSELSGILASLPTLLAAGAPDLGRAAGRLHPLLVHFPIALALVAVAAEWWRAISRRPGVSPLTVPLLWIAAAAAVASTASGWVNAAYEHGNDGSTTLLLHRWLGTATSIALLGLAAWSGSVACSVAKASPSALAQLGAFRWGALVVAAAVGMTGHLGGDMVYGEGYLSKVLFPGGGTAEEPPVEVEGTAPAALTPEDEYFLDTVRPILESNCFECHGARKQKGGLRLDSKAWLFNGDELDWTVIPGHAEESLLLDRVLLGRDDPDTMPPDGPGLTDDEKAALRRWIDEGAAYPDARASGAGVTEGEDGGSNTAPVVGDAAREQALEAAARLVERGVLVQPIAIESPYLDVNAARAVPPLGDEDIAALAALAPLVVNLNLAGSAVTDAGLGALGPLPVLEKLRLDGTSIGDGGLRALGDLPKLESINLVGTAITADCRDWLHVQPMLRRVYVWRTAVESGEAAAALAEGASFEAIGADLPLAEPTTPPMPEDPKPEQDSEQAAEPAPEPSPT